HGLAYESKRDCVRYLQTPGINSRLDSTSLFLGERATQQKDLDARALRPARKRLDRRSGKGEQNYGKQQTTTLHLIRDLLVRLNACRRGLVSGVETRNRPVNYL